MFTSGSTPDTGKPYTSPEALCGANAASSPKLNNLINANNHYLPINAPNCTQYIGAQWVANISNLIAFAIDRAGLTFPGPKDCWNPLLLEQAIEAIVNNAVSPFIGLVPKAILFCDGFNLIRSHGVASLVSQNGAYNIFFSDPMKDLTYSVLATPIGAPNDICVAVEYPVTRTTTSCTIVTRYVGDGASTHHSPRAFSAAIFELA